MLKNNKTKRKRVKSLKRGLKIGSDLDGIFISLPPCVPARLIDFLYRNGISLPKKTRSKIHYTIPGSLEKKIRIITHYPLLRLPIKKNLNTLQILSSKNTDIYLISSRYSFLKKRTDHLLKKHCLNKYFNETYFNYDNKQPHIFKEKILTQLQLDIYIDDDLSLLLYLSKKVPKVEFYWHSNSHTNMKLPKNVRKIKTLSEIYKYVKIT